MSLMQKRDLEIRPLTVKDAETCDQIILTLPRHFGYESGRQACARAVRTNEGLVAALEGRVVGFLTVQPHNTTTIEVTWMAVQADLRGHGIGRRLIEHLRQNIQTQGYRLLLVSTLAPSFTEDPGEEDTLPHVPFIKGWASFHSAKFLSTGERIATRLCYWFFLS